MLYRLHFKCNLKIVKYQTLSRVRFSELEQIKLESGNYILSRERKLLTVLESENFNNLQSQKLLTTMPTITMEAYQ